jgi:hypothetical protein
VVDRRKIMYISSTLLIFVDIICLRGHWTLEITELGIARKGGVQAK